MPSTNSTTHNAANSSHRLRALERSFTRDAAGDADQLDASSDTSGVLDDLGRSAAATRGRAVPDGNQHLAALHDAVAGLLVGLLARGIGRQFDRLDLFRGASSARNSATDASVAKSRS